MKVGDMYNLTCTQNPDALSLLQLICLDHSFLVSDCRFRDAYLSDDKKRVIVYTRIGGPNRQDYKDAIDILCTRNDYVTDYDDSFDNTYASFEFAIPEYELNMVKETYKNSDTSTGQEKMEKSLDEFQKNPDKFLKTHKDFEREMTRVMNAIMEGDGGIIRLGE